MTAAPPRPTALVTGSARRVGRVIAEALVASGYDVVVHARDADAAARAAGELGAFTSFGADLADADQVARLASEVAAAVGSRGLDLLVNAAASFERVERWGDADVAGWARAMDVNARAPYLLTAALLPALRLTRGAVVNVSDIAAHEHWPTYPVHAASKAALESLTRSGARACAKAADGVRMHAIAPGSILPPDDWSAERTAQEDAAGRLSTPAPLVALIIELAADRSRNGEVIRLDRMPPTTDS